MNHHHHPFPQVLYTYQVVLATTEAFGFPPAGTSSSSLGASSSWSGGSFGIQWLNGVKMAEEYCKNGVSPGWKKTLLMEVITIKLVGGADLSGVLKAFVIF